MVYCWKLAGLSVAAWLLLALPVQAKTTETTKYYNISGKTGMELLRDMNRRGPRHGFLTKAIAQTQFKPSMRGDFINRDGVCRLNKASFSLQITYVYPQPTNKLDPSLAKRWRAFQASNIRHEKEHGRLGHRLAAEINQTLKSFSLADKPYCRKADAALAKQIKKMIDVYDKAQRDFDKREHRPGGAVEKSIVALVGKK